MNLRLIRLNLLELHKNPKDKSSYDMVQAILVLCVWPMNKYNQQIKIIQNMVQLKPSLRKGVESGEQLG